MPEALQIYPVLCAQGGGRLHDATCLKTLSLLCTDARTFILPKIKDNGIFVEVPCLTYVTMLK
jgi:hypothetical protein